MVKMVGRISDVINNGLASSLDDGRERICIEFFNKNLPAVGKTSGICFLTYGK